MKDLFLIAARDKYRFESAQGRLTVEQLFQLSAPQLDQMYRSLVQETPTTEGLIDTSDDTVLSNKLEIVKKVFNHLREISNAKVDQQAKAETKRRLLDLIARKQDQNLEEKSIEELTEMVNDL